MNKTTKTTATSPTGRRLAAGAVLALLSVGGVTACAGTEPTAALAPQTKPDTSASTATQAPAGGASAPLSPTPTASHQAVVVQSAGAPATSGTPSCGDKDLKLTIGATGAAMGHDDLTLIYTDIAGHACTLRGYPGAAVVNGSKVVLNAARTLNGYVGDQQQLGSVPLVTLEPGKTASAVLEWSSDNGQACYAKGQGSIKVTAPNTTYTVAVPFIYPYTVGHGGMICSGFEIHPVVAGTIG